MTKILMEPVLFEREFGRTAVRTAQLQSWAAETGAIIPPTVPPVMTFDVVALESLLVAIERGVPNMDAESVLILAREIPADAGVRRLIDDDDITTARWHVAANIHQLWRKELDAAIDAGRLDPVDALTGLRIAANVAAVQDRRDWGPSITTEELCDAFNGLKYSRLDWRKTIDKGPPPWLKACKHKPGKSGASGWQATWFPIAVAAALLGGQGLRGQVSSKRIDNAFNTHPALKHAREEWQAFCANHPGLG